MNSEGFNGAETLLVTESDSVSETSCVRKKLTMNDVQKQNHDCGDTPLYRSSGRVVVTVASYSGGPGITF